MIKESIIFPLTAIFLGIVEIALIMKVVKLTNTFNKFIKNLELTEKNINDKLKNLFDLFIKFHLNNISEVKTDFSFEIKKDGDKEND